MRKRKSYKYGGINHVERKIIPVGGSLAITLPKGWVREHGLKSGDIVIGMANSMLTINPKPIQGGNNE